MGYNEDVPWLQQNFDAMEADLKDDADKQGFRTPKSLRVATCDPDSAASEPLAYEDFQAWLGGGQTRAQFFQDQWDASTQVRETLVQCTFDERAELFWKTLCSREKHDVGIDLSDDDKGGKNNPNSAPVGFN